MTEASFRFRHDGWTPARQTLFVEALRAHACVKAACDKVGLSTTSAYRARARMPEFADAWEHALVMRLPALERAAYARAVEGWEEPILHAGKVVGHRRRYSDSLLKVLLGREGERQARAAEAAAAGGFRVSRDAAAETLMKKLAALRKRLDREAAERQAGGAD